MEKRELNIELEELSYTVTFDELQKIVEDVKRKFTPQGYFEFSIEASSHWDSPQLHVYGKRMETDDEFNSRINRTEINSGKSVKITYEQRKME